MSDLKGDPSQFGPNAPGYTWTRADDVAPLQVFPGITVKPLWEGDNGAKAFITELEPGAVWSNKTTTARVLRRSSWSRGC